MVKRFLWFGATLVVAIAVVAGVSAMVERATAEAVRAQGEELRDEVRAMRSELEACLDDRDRLEAEFRRQETRTNEMRARIDSLESLDPRGVPREHYDDYLALVDDFHESLPRWEGLARELETLSDECTELAREHNARADSLRRFLVGEGLWQEEWHTTPAAPDSDPPTGGGSPPR